MKNVKLYNVGWFPIWLLFLWPEFWFISLPVNFIIDSIVLVIAFAVFKVEKRKDTYLKSIKHVWGYGFVADFIGAIVMMIVSFGLYGGKETEIGLALMMNPAQNKIALLWTMLAIIIAAVFIYRFDSKYAFNNTNMSEKQKKKVSLMMAIFTAPYTMLIPVGYFYYVIWYFCY